MCWFFRLKLHAIEGAQQLSRLGQISPLFVYCTLHFCTANVSRMRALNEPKTAKFEETGAEFCVFKSNAPGLKLNFYEPFVAMPTSESTLFRFAGRSCIKSDPPPPPLFFGATQHPFLYTRTDGTIPGYKYNYKNYTALAVWEIPRSIGTRTWRGADVWVEWFCMPFRGTSTWVRVGHTFGSMRAWQPKCGCSETDLLLAETFI